MDLDWRVLLLFALLFALTRLSKKLRDGRIKDIFEANKAKGFDWEMPRPPKMGAWGKGLLGSIVVIVILFLGLSKSFYIVPSGSMGVVFRLGIVSNVADQGPHLKIPFVDHVEVVNTENIRRLEYGYRTVQVGPPARYQDVPEESRMLTRDNKIVEIDWVLQYQISDPVDYITHIPEDRAYREKMIRDLAESYMREVVGFRILDDVLTKEKQAIQTEVRKGLQEKMNQLSTGIFVSSVSLQDVVPPKAVQKSFNAVNSARAERERMILEAERYAKEVQSEVIGDVERVINEANAYAFRRVALAEGDVARIQALTESYRINPNLVRLNLWMETMTDVWKDMNPTFISSSEVLKILPLDRILSFPSQDGQK